MPCLEFPLALLRKTLPELLVATLQWQLVKVMERELQWKQEFESAFVLVSASQSEWGSGLAMALESELGLE
jgi:hypothetical protein